MVRDYYNYAKMKENCAVSQSLKRERFLRDVLIHSIDQLAPRIMYTAEEFAQVLSGVVVGVEEARLVRSIEETKAYIKPEYAVVGDNVAIFKTLGKYISLEMYHHPFIRNYVYKLYKELVRVSTEPTQAGVKEITLLSYLYPVKRIKERPIQYMEDETWLMAVKAEQLGYIRIQLHIPKSESKGDKKTQKDDLMMKLIDKFMLFS